MNRLGFTNPTKNFVIFNGCKYRINLSFRLVMKYFEIMRDDGLTLQEKIELSVKLLIKDDTDSLNPMDQLKLIKLVYDEKIMTERDQRRLKVGGKGKLVFDFNQDTDLIMAGFRQQYGVDLDIENMDWQKFTAMLDGLTEDTQFRKVIQYRTVKVTDDMPAEQQEFFRQMKLLFSLEKHKTGEKLTHEELELELTGLDMPHKALRMKELRDKNLI